MRNNASHWIAHLFKVRSVAWEGAHLLTHSLPHTSTGPCSSAVQETQQAIDGRCRHQSCSTKMLPGHKTNSIGTRPVYGKFPSCGQTSISSERLITLLPGKYASIHHSPSHRQTHPSCHLAYNMMSSASRANQCQPFQPLLACRNS